MKNIKELNEKRTEEIEHVARTLQRFAGIKSYYLKKKQDGYHIKVEQHKHHTKNYMDKETLVRRAKEYFSRFVNDNLNVVAIPYKESPVEKVNPEWIKDHMRILKVTQKQMVHDLGIGKADVSIVVNGSRSISSRTKASIYYYFKFLALKRRKDKVTNSLLT